MIRAIITIGGEQLIARLDTYKSNVLESVERTMLRIVIGLQRYVILNKLEGDPLHHRTGNLERNVVYEVEVDRSVITGTVGVARGAPYGKVHEYGGTVNIQEQIRTSKLGNQYSVRAHTANYPKRSFLRTSLNENEAQIAEKLQQAVNEAIK